MIRLYHSDQNVENRFIEGNKMRSNGHITRFHINYVSLLYSIHTIRLIQNLLRSI